MPFDKVPLVMIPRFGPTGGLAMCQASVEPCLGALAIAPYRHMICLLWKSGISLAAENSKLKACIDKGRWVTRIRKHNDHAGNLSEPPFAKPLSYLTQGSPAWGTTSSFAR